jgi:hypothetical protein
LSFVICHCLGSWALFDIWNLSFDIVWDLGFGAQDLGFRTFCPFIFLLHQRLLRLTSSASQ